MTQLDELSTSEASDADGRPLSPRNREKAHALGLTSATGLVIGSIVGTGIFTAPAVIAGSGTMGSPFSASSPSAPCSWPSCSGS